MEKKKLFKSQKQKQVAILITLGVIVVLSPFIYTNLAYKAMLSDTKYYHLNKYYDHNTFVKFSTIRAMKTDIEKFKLIESKLNAKGIYPFGEQANPEQLQQQLSSAQATS